MYVLSSGKRSQALQMAKNISVELLDDARSLHEILESCKNLCKLVGISEENSWLDLETSGYLVRYKTRDELYLNLPPYRKTSWKFYDLYGNMINLSPDMMTFFGRSTIYHPVKELENSSKIIVESKFLDQFNKFMAEHGTDHVSRSLKIHEARITDDEIKQILAGVKKQTQHLLDMVISILETE